MKRSLLAWLNTIFLVTTLAVNALAEMLPINSFTTGEVAAFYDNLFTPAGITFSIWSVIYLLLIGFVIYQWKVFVKNEDFPSDQYLRISCLFMASCLLNAGWIIVWHHFYIGWSVVLMLCLLLVLIRLFLMLQKMERNYIPEKVLIHLPFTFYLAWISVATIANVTALLVSAGWNGGLLSPEWWTVIMMGLAGILAATVTLKFKDAGFSLVVAWALLGIFIRWSSTQYASINYAAITIITLLLTMVFYLIVTKKEKLFL